MWKLVRSFLLMMITFCLITYQLVHVYETNAQVHPTNVTDCLELPFPFVIKNHAYITHTGRTLGEGEITKVTELDHTEEAERWNISSVGAKKAWLEGFTGKGVNIAVIDTGISNHPDLKIAGGVSTVDYTSEWSDDNGHGTHIAGVIGAKNDGHGVVGVAPGANLYSVKALNQNGEGQLEDVLRAIRWSIENNMDIINLSIGTGFESTLLEEAINEAYAEGILIVAASGNESVPDSVVYPAKFENVIGVSAVDGRLNLTPFSSYGQEVEFTAPGFSIVSTFIDGAYGIANGTSQAAAHVTGMLALLKEKYPDMTNEELREMLVQHSQDIGDAGRDAYFGHGFISYDALDQDAPAEVGNLVVTGNSPTSISIRWENPEDTDFEKVDIYLNDSFVISIPRDASESSFTFENLEADTEYTVSVYTIDAMGNQSKGKTIVERTGEDSVEEAFPDLDDTVSGQDNSDESDKDCVMLDSSAGLAQQYQLRSGISSGVFDIEGSKERVVTDMKQVGNENDLTKMTSSDETELTEANNILVRFYQSGTRFVKSMVGWLLD
ncbi:S8 family serine peptidase [Oceanobacillus bengalensis]|uniref:Fibronectin type-III domain-containing protein n=1 Tax=Oceanobacillus bengalensis TaxID=1435466 RepID=A0A494YXN2_9BACI|nr:S8 family serine peptidase [Oceanobacillus bengalensis]RKQ14775.1 hypothetical protein D8M05_12065 [Oceanobacillus bengalensis]